MKKACRLDPCHPCRCSCFPPSQPLFIETPTKHNPMPSHRTIPPTAMIDKFTNSQTQQHNKSDMQLETSNFANLLSQHTSMLPYPPHFLLFFLAALVSSIFNATNQHPNNKRQHTRRKRLSNFICLVGIVNGECVHESAASYFEFGLF